MWVKHVMPQFGSKKPAPGYSPDAPLSYLPADGLKQPGDAKGGTGVNKRKVRQDTGAATMKVK